MDIVPDPFCDWKDGQFPEYIDKVIKDVNFEKPTSIQS